MSVTSVDSDLGCQAAERREHVADDRRVRSGITEAEVQLPEQRVELLVDAVRGRIGLYGTVFRTQGVLGFLDGAEGAGREEGEDRRSQAGDLGLRHSTGMPSTLA